MDSAVFVHSSLITLCCASSVMNMIRLFGFMVLVDDVLSRVLACSMTVMVCSVS